MTRQRRTTDRIQPRLAIAVALLGLLALGTTVSSHSWSETPTTDALEAACANGDPHLVTSCYYGLARNDFDTMYDPDAASVALFSDTANNRPHFELATYANVGAVWGLAYSDAHDTVYASAYHKRQLPFGPLGPGGIYAIDLRTGSITAFATVPDAGTDPHEQPIEGTDDAAEDGVGRNSLGDLELSADQTELLVVNMADRRIYRFSVPDGDLLGSFDHGAAGEPWADEARPMGLGVRDGYLYHGVVRSAEISQERRNLIANVYRSRSDGSKMEPVALMIPLTYRRGFVHPSAYRGGSLLADWQYWRDNTIGLSQPELEVSIWPQPMLADIAFDARGGMILGFRDRRTDTSPRIVAVENVIGFEEAKEALLRLGFSLGVGDMLRGGRGTGLLWAFDPSEEHYDDYSAALGDESAQGGLAQLPRRDILVAGSYVDNPNSGDLFYEEGFSWYDNPTGERRSLELVCNPIRAQQYAPGDVPDSRSPAAEHGLDRDGATPTVAGTANSRPTPRPGITPTPHDMEFLAPPSVGDVEAVCASDLDAPTATDAPPTATATPTPSPTMTPAPAYLPLAHR